MKTIKDLTPEIRAKIPSYISKCRDNLYNGTEWENYNPAATILYVKYIYKLAKKDTPKVIIANDPIEYKVIWNKLNKKESGQNISHWAWFCSIYSRVYFTWYYFLHKEFGLETKKSKELNILYHLINKTAISRCWFAKGYCLVLRNPQYIRRNSTSLHAINQPAIEWPNYQMYYINGVKVTKDIAYGNFTKEQFLKEENEEIKSCMITQITESKGPEALLDFLGAVEVDRQTIKHSDNHTEELYLYKTKERYPFLQDHEGNENQPYAWLKEQCPSTGRQYLIPTSGSFTTALQAAKFARPAFVPQDLEYTWTKFAN